MNRIYLNRNRKNNIRQEKLKLIQRSIELQSIDQDILQLKNEIKKLKKAQVK